MYLLKADTPSPYVNESANGLRLNREHNCHLHDRSVLSMPATSAGVTLGT